MTVDSEPTKRLDGEQGDGIYLLFRKLEEHARRLVADPGFGRIEIVIRDHQFKFSTIETTDKLSIEVAAQPE